MPFKCNECDSIYDSEDEAAECCDGSYTEVEDEDNQSSSEREED